MNEHPRTLTTITFSRQLSPYIDKAIAEAARDLSGSVQDSLTDDDSTNMVLSFPFRAVAEVFADRFNLLGKIEIV